MLLMKVIAVCGENRATLPVRLQTQPNEVVFQLLFDNYKELKIWLSLPSLSRVKWVPLTMSWRVLRLRMEEWPPVMEGSCEYID
jgi:hypothetical protein